MTYQVKFNRVHAICSRLRNEKCKGCPAWERDERYGKMKRGCYILAQETINIAKHGHPWSAKQKRKHIVSWRRRFMKHMGDC